MKVLILSSEFLPRRGGIGTYALEMARAACELGHEVTLVAADYGGDQTAADALLPFTVLRYPGGDHAMRELPAKIALVRRLARTHGDFDLVHAADWPYYIPLAVSGYRKRAHCVLTFHGTEVTFMQKPKRALLLRLLRFWNGWADYVANSRYTENLLRKAFHLPQGRGRAVGLGVGKSWISGRTERQAARSTLQLGKDRFIIASLGRVVPRKGHIVLAQALSMLADDILAEIQWQVIGPLIDPAYEAELRAFAATLGCETIITGGLADDAVRLRLSAADLFCLPGYFTADGAVEGFGLVYLEAGALGVPSVATDVGGVPDAVDDGITGLLVPQNDASAIAEAITRLYRDPEARARLADGALARAQRSTWTDVVRQTYKVG